MKTLASIVLAALMSVSVAACAKEDPKADPAKATVTAPAEPQGPGKGEMKQVCKDAVGKDGKPVKLKDGTIKQDCKMIKVRKKADQVTEGSPNDPVKKK
jgi:hypothetical protein